MQRQRKLKNQFCPVLTALLNRFELKLLKKVWLALITTSLLLFTVT
jgi:hypothetical protein